MALDLLQCGPFLLLPADGFGVLQLELLCVDVAAVRGRLDVADDSYFADRSSLAAIELAAVSAISNDAPTLTLDKPSHSPEPYVNHLAKPRRHCSVACVHTSRQLARAPRGRDGHRDLR